MRRAGLGLGSESSGGSGNSFGNSRAGAAAFGKNSLMVHQSIYSCSGVFQQQNEE